MSKIQFELAQYITSPANGLHLSLNALNTKITLLPTLLVGEQKNYWLISIFFEE